LTDNLNKILKDIGNDWPSSHIYVMVDTRGIKTENVPVKVWDYSVQSAVRLVEVVLGCSVAHDAVG